MTTIAPATPSPHSAAASPQRGSVGDVIEVLRAIEAQHHQPILGLREALLQLRLLDESTLDALQREDPSLLRSRSAELV